VYSYIVVVHGPEPRCSNLGSQSYTFDAGQLKAMLRNDEDIKVLSELCHHTRIQGRTKRKNARI